MLTDEQTFKIVYLTSEADAANPVHDRFTLTMNITGVTRAQEFTSSSTYNFEIRDANTVANVIWGMAGDYEFGTNRLETMTVVSGALTVRLPGAAEWATFQAGDSFQVPANAKFQLKVTADTAYLCTYV